MSSKSDKSQDYSRRRLRSSNKFFWQSSPAGVSPGLLALDLGCALPTAPSVQPSPLRDRAPSRADRDRLTPRFRRRTHRVGDLVEATAKRTQRVGWCRKVRNRGPGRVALGRRPQATTTEKTCSVPTCKDLVLSYTSRLEPLAY